MRLTQPFSNTGYRIRFQLKNCYFASATKRGCSFPNSCTAESLFTLAVIYSNTTGLQLKEDIERKIETDFGKNSVQAINIIINAIDKTDYIKTDRVLRCIIYLAKGSIDELHKYIEVATFDTRDVMLWAEYEKLNEDFNYKRVRDFNKTFEESTKDVKE